MTPRQLYETDHDLYKNALLAIRSISESPNTRALVMKVTSPVEMLACVKVSRH